MVDALVFKWGRRIDTERRVLRAISLHIRDTEITHRNQLRLGSMVARMRRDGHNNEDIVDGLRRSGLTMSHIHRVYPEVGQELQLMGGVYGVEEDESEDDDGSAFWMEDWMDREVCSSCSSVSSARSTTSSDLSFA